MWSSSRWSWGLCGLVWLSAGSAAAQAGAETGAAGASTPTVAPATTPVAAPAEAVAPPAGAECVPSCRSGFMCHAGHCVSRCNPPCGRGERCLASGECEVEEDEEEEDEADEHRAIPEPTNGILRPPGSWVFAARGGLQVIGAGHVERSCSSSGAIGCNGSSEADFDERSYVMLGLDALIHVAPGLRLGLGYELVPYSALKGEGDDEDDTVHLGHEHALGAIVEGIIPVGPRLALALRAQGGIRMLALGGKLAEDGDQFLENCHAAMATHCEVDQVAVFGSTFGAMFGFVGAGKVRWRVDLAVQRLVMKLPSSRATFTKDSSISVDQTMYDTRSWVLGGIEL